MWDIYVALNAKVKKLQLDEELNNKKSIYVYEGKTAQRRNIFFFTYDINSSDFCNCLTRISFKEKSGNDLRFFFKVFFCHPNILSLQLQFVETEPRKH